MSSSIRLIIKDDHIKKDGSAPLYLQVFVNKKMVRFPLDLSWSAAHFDKVKGRLKPRSKPDKLHQDYELIINGKAAELTEIFTHYRLAKKELTVEQLKKDYYNWRKREDFFDFWEKEMNDRRRRKKIEEATYICHKSSLSKFKQFTTSCTYQQLTPKLLDNFRAWMKAKLKNMPSTVEKTIKDVRTYVRLAIADGVSLDDPFKVVKVKHIESYPDVLTLDQVKQLIELYEQPDLMPAWYSVLQHSLFTAFTGLRISDIRRVRHDQIIDGALVFPAQKNRNKTMKTVSVPLHPIALKFISSNTGKLFETYSEQYARRVLKEIGRKLEWRAKMGTHIFRHTFATNFIELGGDVVTLQSYLGHSKIQTTMKYVHLSERRQREQIAVFDHFNK